MKQSLSSDLEIRHSNVLTSARFEYSELQLNLFFFIISKLRKSQDSLIYRLDITELSEVTKTQYHLPHLIESVKGMMKQVFSHNTERGPANFIMLEEVVYLTGTKIIEITLTKTVLPHLFDLKNKFTTLGLQAALRLTSKYSKRIYQLCSQWKDLGKTKKYEIQDLKKMLGLIDEEGNEKLKGYKDFRKVVLDFAVKQINEHTELFITYAPLKEGRSVKYITFTIALQVPKTSTPFSLETPQQDTPSFPPGINPKQYETCVKDLDTFYEIKAPKIRQTILNSADYIKITNHLTFEIQRGMVVIKQSRAGMLLTRLGLHKPAKPQPA